MLLTTIYIIAIIAEAMSGAIMAMRRSMDLFGICLIGTITAIGGGTVRDVLLGHYPLSWVEHPEFILFTVLASIVTTFTVGHLHHLRRLFLMVDGLGLVAFTIIGCNVGLESGVHYSIVVIAGMVTGVFGGLLRDILCNQMPLVLQKEIYACVSLAAGAAYVAMLEAGLAAGVASVIALVGGFIFRMLAIHFHWQLPSFKGQDIRGFD